VAAFRHFEFQKLQALTEIAGEFPPDPEGCTPLGCLLDPEYCRVVYPKHPSVPYLPPEGPFPRRKPFPEPSWPERFPKINKNPIKPDHGFIPPPTGTAPMCKETR